MGGQHPCVKQHVNQSTNQSNDHRQLAERAAAVLLAKGPMLDEYFRIGLRPRDADQQGQQQEEKEGAEGGQAGGGGGGTDGFLTSLPDLLPNYTPSPEAIPLFLLRLATEVGCLGWVCEASWFTN